MIKHIRDGGGCTGSPLPASVDSNGDDDDDELADLSEKMADASLADGMLNRYYIFATIIINLYLIIVTNY